MAINRNYRLLGASSTDLYETSGGLGYETVGSLQSFNGFKYSEDSDNWIIIKFGNSSADNTYVLKLPTYPDEISEQTSANFSQNQIVGRSGPIFTFTGTGSRSISFSLVLHRELLDADGLGMEEILSTIRKAVYPHYLDPGPGYIPAIVTVKIGELKARGVCTSMTYNWKKPIIENRYQACDLSFTIESILPTDFNGEADLGSSMNPFNLGQSTDYVSY